MFDQVSEFFSLKDSNDYNEKKNDSVILFV